MKRYRSVTYWLIIVLATINIQACSSIQQMIQGSPTPTLTITPTPTLIPTHTPTLTPKPTSTNPPTKTPNLVATQQYEAFLSLVQKYFETGYIPSINGTYYRLDDYSDSFAKEGSYQWATIDMWVENFILKSHVTMSTANKFTPATGCGIVYRVIGDYTEAVYIKQGGSAFYMNGGYNILSQYYGAFSNPAEFDLILIIYEYSIRFYIDGKEALVWFYGDTYTTSEGDLGFAVISGSNDDYGSRCEFKDTELWVIKR